MLTDTGSASIPEFYIDEANRPKQTKEETAAWTKWISTGSYDDVIKEMRRHPNNFLFKMDEHPNSERMWKIYEGFLRYPDPQAISKFYAEFYSDINPRIKGLRQITCPTLVLLGEFDIVFFKPSEIMAKEIPDVRHVILDGVGHSINYGESRSVVPIGGGIPMARFYFPSIHSRLRYGDALGIVLSQNWLSTGIKYRNNVCKCAQCLKLIKSKNTINEAFLVYGESYPVTFRRRSGTIVSLEYPATEAKQVAACHYLYNKAKEFKDIKNISFKELLKNLTTTYDTIAPISGDSMVAHMNNWRTALQKLTKK